MIKKTVFQVPWGCSMARRPHFQLLLWNSKVGSMVFDAQLLKEQRHSSNNTFCGTVHCCHCQWQLHMYCSPTYPQIFSKQKMSWSAQFENGEWVTFNSKKCKKVEWCSFRQLNLKIVCPSSAKFENGVEGISLSLLNLKMGSELPLVCWIWKWWLD